MRVKNCKKRQEVVFLKKLSIEHPFFEFMGSLGDWMILNVLFVVTCLPVITIIIGFALIIWLNSLFLTVIFDKFIYDGGKNCVG